MKELMISSLTSMEVAEMVDKRHADLLKDIRKYVRQFNEGNISPVEFFNESERIDMKGQKQPYYLVTKKGCEFIAHKLTGQKGTEFTARYINRFHEMENQIEPVSPEHIPIGEVASYAKAMDRIFVRQQLAPHKIAEAFIMVSEQFGIHLPVDCVKVPEYEQLRLMVEQ